MAEAVPPTVPPIETRTAERPELEAALAGRVLHLDGFEASYEALALNNRDNWTPATASDVRMLVRMFRDILEENGVSHSGEIGQQHVAALRQHLNLIPTRYGQSSRLRIMKPAALRAFAADEIARAERRGEAPPEVGLSAATIRKHLGNLDTFLNHVRASGYTVADWSLKVFGPASRRRARSGWRR